MNILIGLLGTVFGFKQGASIGNAATGVANYASMTALAFWAWNHRNEMLTFQVDVGTLCIFGGLLVVLSEAMRRTSPGAGG